MLCAEFQPFGRDAICGFRKHYFCPTSMKQLSKHGALPEMNYKCLCIVLVADSLDWTGGHRTVQPNLFVTQ